jgi:hypothetical protein
MLSSRAWGCARQAVRYRVVFRVGSESYCQQAIRTRTARCTPEKASPASTRSPLLHSPSCYYRFAEPPPETLPASAKQTAHCHAGKQAGRTRAACPSGRIPYLSTRGEEARLSIATVPEYVPTSSAHGAHSGLLPRASCAFLTLRTRRTLT